MSRAMVKCSWGKPRYPGAKMTEIDNKHNVSFSVAKTQNDRHPLDLSRKSTPEANAFACIAFLGLPLSSPLNIRGLGTILSGSLSLMHKEPFPSESDSDNDLVSVTKSSVSSSCLSDAESVLSGSTNLSQKTTTQKKCSYCSTTSTPMWRHGPSSFTHLCNSCGVKWRRGKILQKGMLSNLILKEKLDIHYSKNHAIAKRFSRL